MPSPISQYLVVLSVDVGDASLLGYESDGCTRKVLLAHRHALDDAVVDERNGLFWKQSDK